MKDIWMRKNAHLLGPVQSLKFRFSMNVSKLDLLENLKFNCIIGYLSHHITNTYLLCSKLYSSIAWIIIQNLKDVKPIKVEKTLKHIGILLPKLFWPTLRKNCSSDREKLLKFEAEGREFAKILRSLEQFIQTVKGQNNFW